jgi:MFS family permease
MRDRQFFPLFWTQFLGAFNDNLLKNALVIIVATRSLSIFGVPSDQSVALAGGIFILPFFLFSGIAGELSDNYDKSRVLQGTKLLEIVVMLFSATALWFENFDFLMITLFFMGLQSAFFGPAKFSILPQHLPAEKLMQANAWVEAGTFLAILLGTIAGGLLVLMSNGLLIVASSLVFISILGFLTSLFIPRAPSSHSARFAMDWNPLTTTWKHFQLSAKEPVVFSAMLAGSWFWFVGATVLSVLPVLCLKHLRLPESSITIYLVLFSVGVGLGSFLCSRLSKNKVDLRIVFRALLAMTVCLLYLAHFNDTLIVAGIGLFCLSVASGLYIVPLNTLIQEQSDVKVRSQVIAAYNISNSFFMVLASLMLMVLFSLKISMGGIFFMMFLLSFVTVLSLRGTLQGSAKKVQE